MLPSPLLPCLPWGMLDNHGPTKYSPAPVIVSTFISHLPLTLWAFPVLPDHLAVKTVHLHGILSLCALKATQLQDRACLVSVCPMTTTGAGSHNRTLIKTYQERESLREVGSSQKVVRLEVVLAVPVRCLALGYPSGGHLAFTAPYKPPSVAGLKLCIWHALSFIAAIWECRRHLIKWDGIGSVRLLSQILFSAHSLAPREPAGGLRAASSWLIQGPCFSELPSPDGIRKQQRF